MLGRNEVSKGGADAQSNPSSPLYRLRQSVGHDFFSELPPLIGTNTSSYQPALLSR